MPPVDQQLDLQLTGKWRQNSATADRFGITPIKRRYSNVPRATPDPFRP
jgi:hypothetical protein